MEFGHFKADAFWKAEKCSGHAEYWKCSIVSTEKAQERFPKWFLSRRTLLRQPFWCRTRKAYTLILIQFFWEAGNVSVKGFIKLRFPIRFSWSYQEKGTINGRQTTSQMFFSTDSEVEKNWFLPFPLLRLAYTECLLFNFLVTWSYNGLIPGNFRIPTH